MNEKKVAGSKRSTETRVRICDISNASSPEHETGVPTLHHYVQRNQLPSIKCRVCNIKCGYISLNQRQRVSYVTGLLNRRQLFSAVCPYFSLLLSLFHSVFRPPFFVLSLFRSQIPVFNTYVHGLTKKPLTYRRERIVRLGLVTL
jgi:hypothetical protein